MDRDSKSNLRTLLRGHSKRISDVSFFNNYSNRNDIVGTVAGRDDKEEDCACVLIWRIYKREDELASEKLLEIRLKDAMRIVWHPFNPNQFVLLHNHNQKGSSNDNDKDDSTSSSHKEYNVVATFVETTRLMTIKHETENHAVCVCTKPDEIDGGSNNGGSLKLVCFGSIANIGIHDLAWSNQDARHVVTAHKDGTIKLWDLREIVYLDTRTGGEVESTTAQQQQDGSAMNESNKYIVESAKCIMTLNVNVTKETGLDGEVQRCIFLPSFDDAACTLKAGQRSSLDSAVYNMTSPFLTVTKRGKCVTLWSPFTTTGSPPSVVRTFELGHHPSESEFNVSVCTVANGLKTEGSAPLPSSFVLFADKNQCNVYALHVNSIWCTASSAPDNKAQPSIPAVNGFDYIIPFRVTQPIYSWTTMVTASSDDDEDIGLDEEGWNLDLFCVQSKSVQQLSLTRKMLMLNANQKPINESNLPDGLTVENLIVTPSFFSDDDNDADDLSFEDEEYEIDDDDEEYENDDDDYEDYDAGQDNEEEETNYDNGINEKEIFYDIPSPPMPSNSGNEDKSSSTKPTFANWLGNLAGVSAQDNTSKEDDKEEIPAPLAPEEIIDSNIKSDVDLANVPLPDLSDVEEENAPVEKSKPEKRFLSPFEMLASAMKGTKEADKVPSSNIPPAAPKTEKKESKKKSSQKSKNTQPAPIPTKDGKIAILKREEVAAKKIDTTIKEEVDTSTSVSSVTRGEIDDIIRKALSGHIQRQESVISAEIQKAVRYEVQSGLVPTLNKTVSQTLDQTVSKNMKSTVTKSVKESSKINTDELAVEIAAKLKEPLIESFYQSMRELMIPAFEAGTRQMFEQISASIEKGLELKQKERDEHSKSLDTMTKRMDAMAKTMEVLIEGVAKMAVGVKASPEAVVSSSPVVDKMELLKQKINDLIAAEDYEKAFTTALAASNPNIVLWMCKTTDLGVVLEGETPALSQPIMLCLLQQLGADFLTGRDDDLKIRLAWLQSVALNLDPNDESIKRHLAAVCQGLVTNLQKKVAEPNVILRREMQMLIHVIRGIGH